MFTHDSKRTSNLPLDDIEFFFLVNLLMYTLKAAQMFEQITKCKLDQIPIILSGDFNLDLLNTKHKRFITFMEETLGLTLHSNSNTATNRGGFCIDAIFACHIDKIDIKNYISYFSYHRPIARKDQQESLLLKDEINVAEN